MIKLPSLTADDPGQIKVEDAAVLPADGAQTGDPELD
jgi:hypothetical protein